MVVNKLQRKHVRKFLFLINKLNLSLGVKRIFVRQKNLYGKFDQHDENISNFVSLITFI